MPQLLPRPAKKRRTKLDEIILFHQKGALNVLFDDYDIERFHHLKNTPAVNPHYFYVLEPLFTLLKFDLTTIQLAGKQADLDA